MKTIRIRDILENGQFTISGRVRILRYLGVEHRDKTVTEWDANDGTLPPQELLDHEVIAINVTYDGCLEIEYDGDEYMGDEDFEEE